MRVVTSTFRDVSDRYRKKSLEDPEDGITPEQWRKLCEGAVEHFDGLARKHEEAIDQGREAEAAFWSSIQST